MKPESRILISRTDSIGDVVLTLPMCGLIKAHYPKSRIIFLCRNYTLELVKLSAHVDEVISYDQISELPATQALAFFAGLQADVILHVFPRKEIALLAEKAGIPLRVGTLSRLYHWYTCNRKIHLPRRNSTLHEAQLNVRLLKSIGIVQDPSLEDLAQYYGLSGWPELRGPLKALLDPSRINLIFHPRSKGSAREWGLDNFQALLEALPDKQYKVFVSGTKQEGESMQEWLANHPRITDLTGQMNLREFIAFIAASDALVAASTGPLHIAAALGKTAIGLFAPMRPIHPGRWKPLGPKATALVIDKNCEDCRKGGTCACIRQITAGQVVDLLPKQR